MNENYSDRYDRLKKTGAIVPISFIPEVPEKEEYKTIYENPYNIVPGKYEISNYGNIRSLETGICKCQYKNKNGYYRASLDKKQFPVHRLEMMVFNPNENYKNLQVNHIDGNHSNNILSNLEWVTPKENSDHAMIYGLHKMNGTTNPNNKLSEDDVRKICELIQTGKYYDTEIAEMFNVSYVNISDIHKGKIWTKISKDYDLSSRKPLALTPCQVEEICKTLELNKYNFHEIGRMFGVSATNIRDINEGVIWKEISSKYNLPVKSLPKKFTKEQVHEICKVIESGKYTDSEIARMFGTTTTFMRSLRKGEIHRDVSKNYDITVRKQYVRPKHNK